MKVVKTAPTLDTTLGTNFDEAAYKRLFEFSPMPMGVHIKGEIVYVNHATAKLMAIKSPEELIGRNVMEFVHPDSQAIVKKRVAALYEEGKQHTDTIEEKLIRSNGEVIHVEIASMLFQYEGKVAIQLILRDVTERQNTQVALIESEERFRQLADSMPQMVWTAHPDGTIDYRNKQWFNFTGFDPLNSSSNWSSLLHPDDKRRTQEAWAASIAKGTPLQIEYRLKDHRKPNSYRWFLARAVLTKDSGGKPNRWFGTNTDITDIRRTTQRKKELERITAGLTEQRKQLVALNQAKDEFISLASHQLRTPATGVKQYVGMALEGFAGDLTPELRTFLERAYESNERQIEIINDLLNVAKVDAGKVSLHMEKTDLVALIKSVILEQASHFADREQLVIFKPSRPSLEVPADSNRLRMVLDNLLDNASKYTPHGKSIEVKISKSSGRIYIAVIDEGVGIEPGDINKIFRKFSRLDNALSAHVGGSGLGLYWAQKIIDLHKGTITVTSKPGAGSTFTVSLPA